MSSRSAGILGRRMDERALTERLITYDTSNVDGLRAAAGFIKGWLEAREIEVVDRRRDRARVAGRGLLRPQVRIHLLELPHLAIGSPA